MALSLEQFVNNVKTSSASGIVLKTYQCWNISYIYQIPMFCNFVNVIGNFRELSEIISKSDEILQRNSAHLNTVLETLDIQQHSLGVLAVLIAKYSASQVPVIFVMK